MIPAETLWKIRNQLELSDVLDTLHVPTKHSEGYLRFLCPACREFNTSVNPSTNLGRCFRCRRNYTLMLHSLRP